MWQDSYELRHVKKKKGAIYGWCYSNGGMLKFRYAFNEDKNEKSCCVCVCTVSAWICMHAKQERQKIRQRKRERYYLLVTFSCLVK